MASIQRDPLKEYIHCSECGSIIGERDGGGGYIIYSRHNSEQHRTPIRAMPLDKINKETKDNH